MAYDEALAERVRKVLLDRVEVDERRMFGGIAFMVEGHMCLGVVNDDLVVRVGPDGHADALRQKGARPMDFTGRPLGGMVYVDKGAVKGKRELDRWAGRALGFVGNLPPKGGSKPAVVVKKQATPAKANGKKAGAGFDGFPRQTFAFLRGLEAHNDKRWFEAHRADYEAGYVEPAVRFVEAMGPRLQKISKTVRFEPRVNGSIFRIHRDVRFSADKTPYKAHLDLWFWEGEDKGWDTPGFFLRLLPRRVILGAGMHRFGKAQLASYRQAVVDPQKGKALERTIAEVRAAGPYALGGAGRKKVPRGFDAEHPRAALLLHDGLVATLEQKLPPEAYSASFLDFCQRHFAAVAPLHRWLLRSL